MNRRSHWDIESLRRLRSLAGQANHVGHGARRFAQGGQGDMDERAGRLSRAVLGWIMLTLLLAGLLVSDARFRVAGLVLYGTFMFVLAGLGASVWLHQKRIPDRCWAWCRTNWPGMLARLWLRGGWGGSFRLAWWLGTGGTSRYEQPSPHGLDAPVAP